MCLYIQVIDLQAISKDRGGANLQFGMFTTSLYTECALIRPSSRFTYVLLCTVYITSL